MRVLPGQTIARQFVTRSSSGSAAQADSLPVGVLIRNSLDTVETVTITHVSGGIYRAQWTIPSGWSYGDVVEIRIEASVASIAMREIAWSDVIRRITTAIKGPVNG